MEFLGDAGSLHHHEGKFAITVQMLVLGSLELLVRPKVQGG